MPLPTVIEFNVFLSLLTKANVRPQFNPGQELGQEAKIDDSWWPILIDRKHIFNLRHCVSVKRQSVSTEEVS